MGPEVRSGHCVHCLDSGVKKRRDLLGTLHTSSWWNSRPGLVGRRRPASRAVAPDREGHGGGGRGRRTQSAWARSKAVVAYVTRIPLRVLDTIHIGYADTHFLKKYRYGDTARII